MSKLKLSTDCECYFVMSMISDINRPQHANQLALVHPGPKLLSPDY